MGRERRERSEDQVMLISKAQRLGIRMVREVKEKNQAFLTEILTENQDLGGPIWRKSALTYASCFHVDVAVNYQWDWRHGYPVAKYELLG